MPLDPPAIGIIGFGEVGSSFARGLREEGVTDILAFDKGPGQRQRDLAAARARELGVRLVESIDVLADRAVIFSAVPQDAALEVVGKAGQSLSATTIFADVNSLSPEVKRRAAMLAEGGPSFVDGAIMSVPIQDLHRAQILASGGAAHRFAELLNPLGMRIEVVGNEPGAAAGIKIIRSLLIKSIENALVEALVVARRHGLADQVTDSFCNLLDAKPTRSFVDFLVQSHAVHASRRLKEVEMAIETARQVGVGPLLGRATVERLRLTSETEGLRLDRQAPSLEEALAILDANWPDPALDWRGLVS
ncbi:DUF1932 domain-containing protein [Bosea sp. BH3]|uniref:DUF1932 domain-containing protein n=1 Tax=Bosea sp. BH3 TaxID=2871701 RepID=UPI0021CB6B44|nr:DUF1932 domain-containing protein [Bosea sp. BH3]MCU4181830.1 DUF1932 domain-containing protein [Bosea sp. BH3]